MQPSFRAVGQIHAEWQTFEKPENKGLGWTIYRSDVYMIKII